jgi:hypothetical protein
MAPSSLDHCVGFVIACGNNSSYSVITPLVRMEVFVLVLQTRSLHSLVLLVLSYPILSEYPFYWITALDS